MEDGVSPNTIIIFVLLILLLAAVAVIVYLLYQLKNQKNIISEDINIDVEEFEDLEAAEVEMINNIFEFDDTEAKDIMTHRKNMIVIDGDLSYTDALSYVIEKGKSRFPVYIGDVDHIIGVLHIKDMLSFAQRNELFRTSIKDIEGLVKDVDVVPETLNINQLFRDMQTDKSHMVMVIDEYGQISGLVAMEDIIEEIVGEIEDEHDTEEETIHIISEGTYIMDGMTNFEEVVEELSLPVDENEYETLNGFLISLLDRIPTNDEKAKINAYGYNFSVDLVEDNIIKKVSITQSRSNLAPQIK